MKKCLAAFACLILFSLVLVPPASVYSQRRDTAQRYADDRIVVKLKAGAEATSDADLMAEEIVRAPGARAEVLTNRRHDGVRLIHLNTGLSVEDAVRRAKEDPRVEYAEPDYFVYAMDTIPNDPFFNQMWGLSDSGCSICDPGQQTPNIDAAKAWDITTGSNDIVAVVLDTGVQLEHEDLSANAWVNPREISGNGVDDDGNNFVDDVNGWNFYDGNNQTFNPGTELSHGTHVAGSIGAVGNNGIGVTGVAWHVKLMSLKFLGGPNGKGSTSNAVKGIYYAIDMRNRGVNVRVINASWGGGNESQSLRQAIADANSAGILFVCAAGNAGNNIDDDPDFPAAYSIDQPNAISVAALTQGGSLASFSNFGHTSVSVAAPGVSIFSTYPGTYAALNGTSMSTPYVSGIAVLLWSHEPSLTPAEVKQRIVDTSQPLPSLVSMLARSGRASAYDALINQIAPPQAPEVIGVRFTKKVVTIDGFGFVNGSAIIEVDGEPLPTVDYDSSFALANGTLTQLTVFLGKKPLRRTFPAGVAVSVRVFNPATGERSDRFTTARF
ncbi:MAG TPA: S8 family peptidase [Blastocatellia bacterium]|nr:S8 family peptidase [Blastocatellia bacterium]